MKILILGGTRFVGRAIVDAALARNHDVTLFNRGSDRDVFPSARRISGDRNRADDVAQLAGDRWDAVVDVSAYHPNAVRLTLDAIGDHLTHYVYVSTISVYADPVHIGADEAAPLLQVDETIPADDPRAYGGLKALCEKVLHERLAGRLTVLRPTVVIGPHDYTDRFPWWVRHIARGGAMRVPKRLEQPTQLIDAADLATFAMLTVEQRVAGTFNAVGPRDPLTLRGMVEMLSRSFHSQLDLQPAPSPIDADAFPLTLPADGSADGVFSVSGAAAFSQGLTLRPLTESGLAVLGRQRGRAEAV